MLSRGRERGEFRVAPRGLGQDGSQLRSKRRRPGIQEANGAGRAREEGGGSPEVKVGEPGEGARGQ